MATSQPQPQPNTATITVYLEALRREDPTAAAKAMESLYPDLRRIAQRYMSRERSGHTLPPKELLHAAYLELVNQGERSWTNRIHFLGAAAQSMRRILTDYARARLGRKRGGHTPQVAISDDFASITQRPEQYLAIERALTRLNARDPELAKIVEMRCFGGLAEEEIALALGAPSRTVKRRWKAAKEWLEANSRRS